MDDELYLHDDETYFSGCFLLLKHLTDLIDGAFGVGRGSVRKIRRRRWYHIPRCPIRIARRMCWFPDERLILLEGLFFGSIPFSVEWSRGRSGQCEPFRKIVLADGWSCAKIAMLLPLRNGDAIEKKLRDLCPNPNQKRLKKMKKESLIEAFVDFLDKKRVYDQYVAEHPDQVAAARQNLVPKMIRMLRAQVADENACFVGEGLPYKTRYQKVLHDFRYNMIDVDDLCSLVLDAEKLSVPPLGVGVPVVRVVKFFERNFCRYRTREDVLGFIHERMTVCAPSRPIGYFGPMFYNDPTVKKNVPKGLLGGNPKYDMTFNYVEATGGFPGMFRGPPPPPPPPPLGLDVGASAFGGEFGLDSCSNEGLPDPVDIERVMMDRANAVLERSVREEGGTTLLRDQDGQVPAIDYASLNLLPPSEFQKENRNKSLSDLVDDIRSLEGDTETSDKAQKRPRADTGPDETEPPTKRRKLTSIFVGERPSFGGQYKFDW